MNTNNSTTVGSSGMVIVLGLAAVGLVYVVTTGRNLSIPFISTDRAALIGLLVLGMTMCAIGGVGKAASDYGWSNPVTIIGSVLGAVALFVVIAVLVGVQLPFITNERSAFMLLVAIIVVKLVLHLAAWAFSRINMT